MVNKAETISMNTNPEYEKDQVDKQVAFRIDDRFPKEPQRTANTDELRNKQRALKFCHPRSPICFLQDKTVSPVTVPQFFHTIHATKSAEKFMTVRQFNSRSLSADTMSVIVFDWDDTLLCTSELYARELSLDSRPTEISEIAAELENLSKQVEDVLLLALSLSHVAIVTNGDAGWVQLSAEKFMPRLVPLLKHISVISARTKFERYFRDNTVLWKQCAFHDLMCYVIGGKNRVNSQILSIGDSDVERTAVFQSFQGWKSHQTKSLKLKSFPCFQELFTQLRLLRRDIPKLFLMNRPLDMHYNSRRRNKFETGAATEPAANPMEEEHKECSPPVQGDKIDELNLK